VPFGAGVASASGELGGGEGGSVESCPEAGAAVGVEFGDALFEKAWEVAGAAEVSDGGEDERAIGPCPVGGGGRSG
jgi:hypothetical protein